MNNNHESENSALQCVISKVVVCGSPIVLFIVFLYDMDTICATKIEFSKKSAN